MFHLALTPPSLTLPSALWIRRASPEHLFFIRGEDEDLAVFAKRIREELSLEPRIARPEETIEV